MTAGGAGGSDRNDFEFSLSGSSVVSLGLTVLSRSGSGGTANFIVTFDNDSTLNVSDAIATSFEGDDTFFQLDAGPGRTIKSFKVDLTGDTFFTGIDDVAFTVVPEPSGLAHSRSWHGSTRTPSSALATVDPCLTDP